MPFRLFRSYLLFFLISLFPIGAMGQVAITGVKHTLGLEDKLNHLSVYVLNGEASNISIKGPQGGVLMRYTDRANDATSVASASLQPDGQTWLINNPELDCGYFVRKEGSSTDYYWFINYQATPLPTDALIASDAEGSCLYVHIGWNTELTPLKYNTPLGIPQTLARELSIAYPTLRYKEADRDYAHADTVVLVEPNGFGIDIEASLIDSEYTLLGDRFSKQLGTGYSPISSDIYQTKRLDVHAYADFLDSNTSDTPSTGDGAKNLDDISAPQTVSLSAIANEPSASQFSWVIYPTESGTEQAIVRFSGRSFVYTFERAGRYTMALEVSNRDGSCSDKSQTWKIQIRESMLKVPNAFSPGSSPGINDIFKVKSKSLVKFNASVYNRTGQLIYRWTDPDGGWDGYIKGRLADTGVYFYVITATGADGISYNERGHINILRASEENDPYGNIQL